MKFKQLMQRLQRPVSQRGYMLVGLMAALTISMIGLAAAMPQVNFEMQREKEEELLWRGQQVATALQNFRVKRGNQLPTSLEELVEGINTGVKKERFLRPHALCDPMLPCTPGKSNWRLVHPGDPVIASMFQSLQAYQQKKQEYPQIVQAINLSLQQLQPFVPQVNIQGGGLSQPLGASPSNSSNPDPNNPNAAPSDSAFGGLRSEKGPIVGVVSRSRDKLIRAVLDIEQYDKSLFFTGGTVIAGGFITPLFSGAQQAPAPITRCADGGIWFPDPTAPGGGRCFGGIPPVKRPQPSQ